MEKFIGFKNQLTIPKKQNRKMDTINRIMFSIFLILLFSQFVFSNEAFTEQDILNLQYVTNAVISPAGDHIAYTVSIPREAGDKPGSSYSELYVLSLKDGKKIPFITGKTRLSSIAWKPDGSAISFLSRRDAQATQVWSISLFGGEAKQLTNSETSVLAYEWHPDKNEIAYISTEPKTKREKALQEKGYDFIYYEENLKHRNVYVASLDKNDLPVEGKQITTGITAWSLEYSPDGTQIAIGASKKNLIDYRYAFHNIYLVDVEKKSYHQFSDNPGKLGNYQFSPDGKHIVYTAALRKDDHAVSQVLVQPLTGGKAKNITIKNFKGHVEWANWKDNKTVVYRAAEGVWNTFFTVTLDGNTHKRLLESKSTGVVFDEVSYTADFKKFCFLGSSAEFPSEIYYWEPGKEFKRLTNSNDWLSKKELGNQKVIKYNARDGLEIEGILIYPVDYAAGARYPLMVVVHGGPESHYSNGWMSSYSRPGQVLANKGYFVFYLNYRASTGYGVEFAMKWHLGNAAGNEFDDVADGIDHLAETGLADRSRVGLMGGSYGGFAAAWFGTYYTKYVKAVGMFVGISDLISKRSTTDIPYEELFVHSKKPLEEMWEFSLKRSPIYYAHQSKTAVLIYGGTDDPRVHPSQSLELYRRLKMNNHPAVRLVQYPGEEHGNRNQPGRIDVLYRTIQWFDWYVKEAKPLDGPMPPLDISDTYGLDLPDSE